MSKKTEPSSNHISLQLADYLDKHTKNAILLTASWGSGKTHYIKNVFFDIIKDRRYEKVYVSLFGIHSIDDIKERIFLEIYPLLENKTLKASSTIFKAILKSIDITKLMSTKGLAGSTIENLEGIGTAIKTYKKDTIDLNKLVICLDDLERMDPALLAENQILGYVNSLVEDDNIKVVIIANEPEIKNKRYKSVKEKVIANTIYFKQEFTEAFESILQDIKSQQTDAYLAHLRLSSPIIHTFLLKENNKQINYRTLYYFLAYYEPIWRAIQKGTGIDDLDEKRIEILDYLLKFTLFICVQFKKGTITFHDPAGLNAGEDYHVRKILNESLKSSENKVDQLIESYFQETEYIYYKSIYNYLTGGDYFDFSTLVRELSANYHVQGENISPSYKIFNKLSSTNHSDIPDREYLMLLRELKDHALSGHFFLKDYPTVFYYLFRYGNVLNLKKESMTKKFMKAIQKTGVWQPHVPFLNRYISSTSENELHEYYLQLFKVMNEVNLKAKEREDRKISKQIELELIGDFSNFYRRVIEEFQSQKGMTITLRGSRPKIFFQAFKNSSNKQKKEMISIIRILFEPYFGDKEEERKYLQEIHTLNANFQNNVKNISGALHEELQEYLVELIQKRS